MDYFCSSPGSLCNLGRKSPQNVEKIAQFPDQDKRRILSRLWLSWFFFGPDINVHIPFERFRVKETYEHTVHVSDHACYTHCDKYNQSMFANLHIMNPVINTSPVGKSVVSCTCNQHWQNCQSLDGGNSASAMGFWSRSIARLQNTIFKAFFH